MRATREAKSNFGDTSGRSRVGLAAAALICSAIAGVAWPFATAGASNVSSPILTASNIKGYGSVLGTAKGYSLYVPDGGGNPVPCTSAGGCTAAWPPLVVPKGTKITVGAGVKGKVGWVTRGSKWQVTYNGWPLYVYFYDDGAHHANGEKAPGPVHGSTWYLVSASAKTKASTPDK